MPNRIPTAFFSVRKEGKRRRGPMRRRRQAAVNQIGGRLALQDFAVVRVSST
jgi:hypothetical protein